MAAQEQAQEKGAEAPQIEMYFGEGGELLDTPPEGRYIMVKAKKMYEHYGKTIYDIEIYMMPQGKKIFAIYDTLDEAKEWGSAFAAGLSPLPEVVQEVQKYNNITIFNNWRKRDEILKKMVAANYRCEDILDGEIVENNGIHFTYIYYDGPDTYVHNFVCMKPGERVTVRYRGRGAPDSMGCIPSWDEVVEYENNEGEIVWRKISGKVDLECPPRPEKIPATRLSDVRDLYPL